MGKQAPFAQFALLAVVIVQTDANNVSPIQKVLEMMEEMAKKAKKEKDDEVVAFAKFEQFCQHTITTKAQDVTDAATSIELLQADILKYQTDAKGLSQDIAELDASMDTTKKDLKDAADMRAQQHKDFEIAHTDYVVSLDDMAVALMKLKKMMKAHPGGAAALVQEEFKSLIGKKPRHKALAAMLQFNSGLGDVGVDVTAPEANAFETQSGGVVDMIEKLQEKMEDEKADLERAEMNEKHSFQMMTQSLTDQLSQMGQSRTQKAVQLKDKETKAGEAKGQLQDTQMSKSEDEKYLSDMKTECKVKTAEFEIDRRFEQKKWTRFTKQRKSLEASSDHFDTTALTGAVDGSKHDQAAVA
jgi:hypothetical protein